MPFISDTASAIKSRFGFHDHALSSANPLGSSPDFLKSASKESVAQSSAIRSIGEFNDADVGAGSGSQSFEFCEDPSFWNDHNVQVIIRIRPLSSSEISLQGYGKCVRQESCQAVTWTGHPESRFTFDLVADENVSQENLFKVAGLPMVDNCVGGYNSCMFAYGQTGSGKTHTMLGDIEGGTRRHSANCGMTPRVFEYLFSRIQKEKESRKDEKLKYTCKCSFLEIYNEQILDLLDPSSNNLQIREDNKKGIYVENLKEIEVSSARDVLHQLIQGAANRKVASTNMNRASSRSHSVFTCIIESKWESQGIIHHRFARLNLVDLAGSERQKSSGAEGERLKEATNINKSLSTLGLVIMNLVNQSNGKSLHVPYRDSKLTFLLQDSLGGNSKTIIIANVSPSSCCSLETLSTLKFAQRAKFIKNNAIVNEDTSGDVIAMRSQIQQLKKEVSRLRGLVNGADSQDADNLVVSFPGSPGTFKWEGHHGSLSPLTTGKRMSQRRDYEVALVGAFRREKDKDMAFQALANENQAAMQLVKRREDEIQGLKMRLRFREAGIKRLEAVACGKISAETHLLKEKEEHLKELEVLRNQVDRNQEVTRFAMENLNLKEEIRRLKSFYEEGERETVHEQIMILENKLLEALDWKLMHESDPSTIQNGNPDTTAEVGDDNFLNPNQGQGSPWKSSINEENEFLRMQAIHNQDELDTLRKKLELCLEEKENLERHVEELVGKLESKEPSRTVDEAEREKLPLVSTDDMPIINFSDQIELKTMVDAIAAASQREAKAHEIAINLSKENDELRVKLRVLIKDNNKLIELYEKAVSEYGSVNKDETAQKDVKVEENTDEKQAEMTKVVESLQQQLAEMHEENDKLMSLYEGAMQEKDELKRKLSSLEHEKVDTEESDCIEKFVEVDEVMHDEFFEPLDPNKTQNLDCESVLSPGEFNDLAAVEAEEFADKDGITKLDHEKQMCAETFTDMEREPKLDHEKQMCAETITDMERESSTLIVEMLPENLSTIRKKLEIADEQLSDSSRTVTQFSSIEKTIIEAHELSTQVETVELAVQVKQKELESYKLLLSRKEESRDLAHSKFCALKYSLSNFSTSMAYFEQRESRARVRAQASKTCLDQKAKELALLQTRRDEIESIRGKIQQSEIELRNNLASLKIKVDEESQKQENDKVLFAIENVEKTDSQPKNWQFSGRATDLLKSEEEKTKLQNEIKLAKENLGTIRKELEDLTRKSRKADSDIEAVQLVVQKASKSADELETALQAVTREKVMLLETRDAGITEFENIILEYQERLFESGLKEAEMKILEEELQMECGKLEELVSARSVAVQKTTRLLEAARRDSSFLSERMEEELRSIRSSVMEATSLLGEGILNHS